MGKFSLIYSSKAVKVINKPSGIVSTDISELICHRLDKATSGLLIVAKDKQVKKQIQEQFKKREIEKDYLAFVLGKVDKKQTVEGWLERDPKNKKLMRMAPGFVRSADSQAQAEKNEGRNKRYSKTVFKSKKLFYKKIFKANKKQFNYFSLLEAQIFTGRKHQIRAHSSYIDRPILGDSWYNTKISRQVNEKLNIDRLMLHAKRISFYDPAKKSRVEVKIEKPQKFKDLENRLEIQ